MKKQLSTLLGVSALALVLGSPAFAQTVSLQQSTGNNNQNNQLNSSSTGTGITVTNGTSQTGTAAVNQFGGLLPAAGVASPSVSVTTINDSAAGFSLQQVTGPTSPASPNIDTSTLLLINSNSVSAIGNSSLSSAVTAAGDQTVSGNVNTLAIAGTNLGTTAAQGSIGQVLNQGGALTSSSVNSILARAASGAATVGISGTTTLQSANNNLNSALVSAPSAGLILGVDQKANNSGFISTWASNSATVNSSSGGVPTIDPSINSLTQASSTNLNTLSAIGTNALALSNGTTSGAFGSGGQNAVTNGVSSGSTADLGNVATATTGNGTLGVGSTAVNTVNQSASLNVNTVSGGGSIALGNSSSPFQQTVGSTTSASSTLVPAGLSGTLVGTSAGTTAVSAAGGLVNNQLAATNNGNAAINSSTASSTQSYGLTVNGLSAAGSLSGNLLQTAGTTGLTGASSTQGAISAPALANAAGATTALGNASVSNVGQQQVASLNSVSAAGGAGLTLTQTSLNPTAGTTGFTATTLGGTNAQTATTANGMASLTGATQVLGASLNSANVGSLSGTVIQSAAGAQLGVSSGTANTLTASGSTSVISGASQSSTTGTNVVK